MPTQRRLQAPEHSGETLIQPPLDQLPGILDRNRQRFRQPVELCGCALQQLRETAIADLIRLATAYTRSYRDVDLAGRDAGRVPVILSGHQPQLFHPGVWFKNFALASCWPMPALAVHLIIDNDVCLHPSIRVPAGPVADPSVNVLPYDVADIELPFEERQVRDRDTFNDFGDRAARAIAPLVARPLVREYWPLAVQRSRHVDNLGLSLSQARHQLEARRGMDTLELPLSRICQSHGFRIFLLHALCNGERLRDDYNRSLIEYRRAQRIRSRSHPVPELDAADGYVESPFWIWSRSSKRRRRLFVKRVADDLQISDRAEIDQTIRRAGVDAQAAAAQVDNLERMRGVKIRPRALTTTMFARLVLSDVFFHGIGGAKYDRLTDAILRRFFGVEPPEFITMTATARLPIPLPETTEADLRVTSQRLRDTDYHPERFIDRQTAERSVVELLEAKQGWIGSSSPQGEGVRRHRELASINARLRDAISGQRVDLQRLLQHQRGEMRRKSLLGSREFSFCLFPAETFDSLVLALS